jgi:hypothetical protein
MASIQAQPRGECVKSDTAQIADSKRFAAKAQTFRLSPIESLTAGSGDWRWPVTWRSIVSYNFNLLKPKVKIPTRRQRAFVLAIRAYNKLATPENIAKIKRAMVVHGG